MDYELHVATTLAIYTYLQPFSPRCVYTTKGLYLGKSLVSISWCMWWQPCTYEKPFLPGSTQWCITTTECDWAVSKCAAKQLTYSTSMILLLWVIIMIMTGSLTFHDVGTYDLRVAIWNTLLIYSSNINVRSSFILLWIEFLCTHGKGIAVKSSCRP